MIGNLLTGSDQIICADIIHVIHLSTVQDHLIYIFVYKHILDVNKVYRLKCMHCPPQIILNCLFEETE